MAIEFDVQPDGAKGLNVNKKHQLEEIPVKGLFVVDFETDHHEVAALVGGP